MLVLFRLLFSNDTLEFIRQGIGLLMVFVVGLSP